MKNSLSMHKTFCAERVNIMTNLLRFQLVSSFLGYCLSLLYPSTFQISPFTFHPTADPFHRTEALEQLRQHHRVIVQYLGLHVLTSLSSIPLSDSDYPIPSDSSIPPFTPR